jgi:hyperosmotically inducible protein
MKKSIIILLLTLFLSSMGTTLLFAENPESQAPMRTEREPNLSKTDVMKVQEVLKSEGLYTGQIDGVMGPLTRSALQEYQRQHNLLITGRIDEQTAKSMNLDIAFKSGTEMREEGRSKEESGVVSTLKNVGGTIKEGAVTGGKAVGEAAQGVGGEISDATITSAIKTKFASDEEIKAFDIDVDTENGIVTLTPHVQGVNMDRASRLAREVAGVKEVRVKPVESR